MGVSTFGPLTTTEHTPSPRSSRNVQNLAVSVPGSGVGETISMPADQSRKTRRPSSTRAISWKTSPRSRQKSTACSWFSGRTQKTTWWMRGAVSSVMARSLPHERLTALSPTTSGQVRSGYRQIGSGETPRGAMAKTSAEFEKATDYRFKEEDIERAKALVGSWAPSRAREHLTTGTHDAFRNFARGYGDDNPLFNSEDYGAATRWRGQIAPPMIAIALNRPLYGDPPDRRVKRPSFRGIHVFVSGSTWNWYRPLMEGDQLYSFGGTESVVEKKSEFAERSVLITYASVKMNQRGEIVA